jgi:hypothetical protein
MLEKITSNGAMAILLLQQGERAGWLSLLEFF